jgi:energy-coupling factor transporter transmembrane protein EcfT
MAELNLFHYSPRQTPLHRLDPRMKTVLVLLIVFLAVGGNVLQLSLLCLYLLVLLVIGRVAVWRYGRELRVFAVLAAVLFFPHALGGDTLEGIHTVWRFLIVVTGGLLYTAVTAPWELHGTARWLLRPVPFIREGAAATHISLSLLFVPLLLDTLAEVREARKSRFAEGIRNPVVRIRGLTAPLLEKLFQQIDEVAFAMESRCYSDDAARVALAPLKKSLPQSLLFLLPFLLPALLPVLL